MTILKLCNKVLLVGGVLFLITACHTNHLSLDYKVIDACYADSSTNEIAFFLRSSAYYKAKGVSKFPDGGATTDQNFYKYENDTILIKKIKTHNAVRLSKKDDSYISFFGIDYDTTIVDYNYFKYELKLIFDSFFAALVTVFIIFTS
jgi:hypothetical protein